MIKPAWFDAFFILRPTLFFPSWTFFLAGYSRGQGSGPGLILIWLAAALGVSFLLNQLADRREDRFNDKLWPLWSDQISSRKICIELWVLISLVILGCVYVGLELTGLLALFLVIAGVLYNFPPLRLKARPILGIVSCGVGVWIGYLIGARAAGVPYPSALLLGLPYVLAGAAVSMLTHVPDLGGDRRAGIRTFPLVYGMARTGAFALGLVMVCALVSFALADYILLIAAIVSLPFFVRFYVLRSAETAELAVKISIFSLAVAVGLTWIPFLFMIVLYYPLARWYHRRRLGLDYPSFHSRSAVQETFRYSEAGLKKASGAV